MEQVQSSAPPVQALGLSDEELKTPVVDAPPPVIATSHQEESKAPADVPAPVAPAPLGEESDAPRAETPGTELGPNET